MITHYTVILYCNTLHCHDVHVFKIQHIFNKNVICLIQFYFIIYIKYIHIYNQYIANVSF